LTVCSESFVHFIEVLPALICGAGPAASFSARLLTRGHLPAMLAWPLSILA
jgi:hypothetical protein